MYKCQNCGTEFDTKFCPNCGTPAPADVCPYCGALLSPNAKFCPDCGKALGGSGGAKSPSPANSAGGSYKYVTAVRTSSPLVKFCSFLPYAATAMFIVFSAILFLIFLGPVSTTLGMGTGSVYNYVAPHDELSDFSNSFVEAAGGDTVTNICVALVVFAAIGGAWAVLTALFRFCIPLRVKKMGKRRAYVHLQRCIFVIYSADFVLACILCSVVGSPLSSPGAAPVCVLVFSLFFALCHAAVAVMQFKLKKFFPAAAAELEKREKERRAYLTKPVEPQRLYLPAPVAPKYEGECPEKLKKKILAHVKWRRVFSVFSALMMLCFSICLFALLYVGVRNSDAIDFLFLFAVSFIIALIIALLICNRYVQKEKPNFDWRKRGVWSNAAMYCTISVSSFIIILSSSLFVAALATGDEAIEFSYFIPFFIAAGFIAVYYSVAATLQKRGEKFSLEVFGVKQPELLPRMKEARKAYSAQRMEYFAAQKENRRAWRNYRMDCAYYEEGIKR